MEAGTTAICLGLYQHRDKEGEKQRKAARVDRGMNKVKMNTRNRRPTPAAIACLVKPQSRHPITQPVLAVLVVLLPADNVRQVYWLDGQKHIG